MEKKKRENKRRDGMNSSVVVGIDLGERESVATGTSRRIDGRTFPLS